LGIPSSDGITRLVVEDLDPIRGIARSTANADDAVERNASSADELNGAST